jgi:hypothetical protein
MPRKGRGTELVLKELESLTLRDQAEIKSPDYIIDVVTRRPREVDISIRHKMGTHKFLTVIECRDRKEKEDVTWIEQIVTKTKNIQANRVIAVSTSGFTSGAKDLAQHENIVLRTLRDFKANETTEWMDTNTFEALEKMVMLRDIYIQLVQVDLKDKNKAKNYEANYKLELNKKEFKESLTGSYVNLLEIINNENNDFFFNDLNIGIPVIKKMRLTFTPENRYLFKFEDRIYHIKYIDVEMECSIILKSIPITKTIRYAEEEKPFLDKVDYGFTLNEKQVFISLAKDHTTGNRFINAHYTTPDDNEQS